MSEKQKTIRSEIHIEGKGIHTGRPARVVLKPAPPKSGVCFTRADVDAHEKLRATVEHVQQDHGRQTALGTSRWKVRTVEHLMASFHGLGVDNVVVEVSGEELPALDGSAKGYVDEILKVGLVEQEAPRQFLQLTTPIYYHEGDCTLAVFPSSQLSVSYSLSYGSLDLSDQFFSSPITPQIFVSQVASARTFCLKEEAELLRKSGYGQGADFQNTLVFEKNQPIENELRFDNEACRHKVMDLIGDLYLIGQPIKAHVIAIRSGHQQNVEIVKRLADLRPDMSLVHTGLELPVTADAMGLEAIKKILPHRYPFLFIDRILEMEVGKRIVGIKKVTPDEFFFQGHFPGHPVMPGVLIIEALAQCGGFLMLSKPENRGKIAYFMTIEKAKFRRPVLPGEELRLEAEVTRDRIRTGECRGQALVDGNVVCEAEVRFAVVDP